MMHIHQQLREARLPAASTPAVSIVPAAAQWEISRETHEELAHSPRSDGRAPRYPEVICTLQPLSEISGAHGIRETAAGSKTGGEPDESGTAQFPPSVVSRAQTSAAAVSYLLGAMLGAILAVGVVFGIG